MNVKDFLQGKFSQQFTDQTLCGVMLERGISLEAQYDQVTKKQLDLARADLFDFLSTYVSQGSESVKKGSWSHTTANIAISDKERLEFRRSANAIYETYGEPTKYSMKDQTNDW